MQKIRSTKVSQIYYITILPLVQPLVSNAIHKTIQKNAIKKITVHAVVFLHP